MHYRSAIALLICGTSASFAVSAGYRHYQFPYGRSHCCDKALHMTLHEYAEQHEGQFPAGEQTPEASLSLLYRDFPDIAPTLRGKTAPEDIVIRRLESGQLLTPETCGWHYVEGLSTSDNPELALFWDKAGLGHNGERLKGGGHHVFFVGGFHEHILAKDWDEFLARQEELHRQRNLQQ